MAHGSCQCVSCPNLGQGLASPSATSGSAWHRKRLRAAGHALRQPHCSTARHWLKQVQASVLLRTE